MNTLGKQGLWLRVNHQRWKMNNLGKQGLWLRVNHQKMEDEESRKTRSLVKGKPSKDLRYKNWVQIWKHRLVVLQSHHVVLSF